MAPCSATKITLYKFIVYNSKSPGMFWRLLYEALMQFSYPSLRGLMNPGANRYIFKCLPQVKVCYFSMFNLRSLTLHCQEHISQAASVLNDANIQDSEDLVGVFQI